MERPDDRHALWLDFSVRFARAHTELTTTGSYDRRKENPKRQAADLLDEE